jgi:hypothetical protein
MASLQMMISKNWINGNEWKVKFLLSKHHQTRLDVRHRVGHGLETLTMKKNSKNRLNRDGLSGHSQRQTKAL